MDRKKIFFIIIFSLVVFFGIIAFFVFIEPRNIEPEAPLPAPSAGPAVENTPAVSNTPITASSTFTQDEALAVAKQNKNSQACFKIAKGGNPELCIELLAQYLQSAAVCADIADKTMAAECSDWAVFKKAVNNNEIDLCSQISEAATNQACVQKIIDNKKWQKNDCASLPEKEKTICLNYLSYLNDYSIFVSAKSQADCQGITDSTTKEFCLQKF